MVSEATIPGLEKLHDIVVPAPVSWAPQAPGWYVVFGLVLLGVGWWIYRRLRRFRKNRYRRLALKELTVIERQLQQPERRAKALAEIPALLKWTALEAFPRSEVAALTGEQWLAFLDRNLGGKDFKEGPGRFLSELAYAPAEKTARFSDESIRNLLQLIRRWTKRHEMS
jgi:cbb3-type cytochrome oxidase subunit 3